MSFGSGSLSLRLVSVRRKGAGYSACRRNSVLLASVFRGDRTSMNGISAFRLAFGLLSSDVFGVGFPTLQMVTFRR